MSQDHATDSRHCTHPSLLERGSLSLPVLADHSPQGQIRPSRNAKRRAVVLITVQLVLIAHIVLWLVSKKYGWFGGKTISPIEPSESMQFVQDGYLNAGLIFFSIALLSTMVLGRWFCGWGCHVVMLQDFCGWIMKKCGVRPKPFRSRVLVYVPLALALYMFVMPMVYRIAMVPADQWMIEKLGAEHWAVQAYETSATTLGFALPRPVVPAWQMTTHFTTDDFWRTFASYGVAIPFLFICGFAVVYFLGSKGFCTYGCPYGGFFSPLDRLAPARILVTDACEGCGHCTAVCTSNVRVHEEVREYGMVVDPGCMKCLDCVSVCPNEALYFGFAKPALMKGKAKHQKPRKVYDLTLGEEIGCTLAFIASFLAVRGVYEVVPMLMAAGVAGIVTFAAWKCWRLWRDPSVTFHRLQLKLKGSMRPAGYVFACGAALVGALTAHSGFVNFAFARARSYDAKVTIPQEMVFNDSPMQLSDAMAADAAQGLKWYTIASSIGDGGIGLLRTWQWKIDLQQAWLHSARHEFADAEAVIRRAISRDGPNEDTVRSLIWVMFAEHKEREALDLTEPMLLEREDYASSLDSFGQMAGSIGQLDRAVKLNQRRLEKYPNHLHTMRVLSLQLLSDNKVQEGVDMIRKTLEVEPNNASARYFLALGLAELNQMDEAEKEMREAARLDPNSVPINSVLANLLEQKGQHDEAETYRQKAQQLKDQAQRAHSE